MFITRALYSLRGDEKTLTSDPMALLAGWKMIDPTRERIMMIKPNVFRMIESLEIVWPGVCEIAQFTMIP